MPDDFRVAVAADDVPQHGILLVLRPGSPAVVAVGDALRKRHRGRGMRPGRGVDGHQDLLPAGLPSGSVRLVDDGRAGVDRAQLVGLDGVGQLRPMDQVRADRMAPGHVAPVDSRRVVLEEHVVLAVVVDQPVGIVVPVLLGREMELGTIGLLIEPIDDKQRALGLVALGDALMDREASVGRRQLFDLELARLAFQFGDVPTDPVRLFAVGPAVGADGFAVDDEAGGVTRSLPGAQAEDDVVVLDADILEGRNHPFTAVALDDVVDVDVPPSAGGPVDDFDPGGFIQQIADVPGVGVKAFGASRFAVRTGCRAGDVSVDEQVDARLLGMPSAADEEIDVLPLDHEFGRGQRAGGRVSTVVAVHQPLAFKSAHDHLVGQRTLGGPGPEGLAGRLPVAVIVSLEVGDKDVGLLGAGAACKRRQQDRAQKTMPSAGHSHVGFPHLGGS